MASNYAGVDWASEKPQIIPADRQKIERDEPQTADRFRIAVEHSPTN